MKQLFSVLTLAVLIGCTAPQARVTYNTLFSVEQTTLAAYDGYLDLVIHGKVPTNDVPKISKAFNEFQVLNQAAVELASHSTNAPAPPNVIAASAKVTTAISTAKGK